GPFTNPVVVCDAIFLSPTANELEQAGARLPCIRLPCIRLPCAGLPCVALREAVLEMPVGLARLHRAVAASDGSDGRPSRCRAARTRTGGDRCLRGSDRLRPRSRLRVP